MTPTLDHLRELSDRATPGDWLPIETAPKDGRQIVTGYRNERGKWHVCLARYHAADTLLAGEDDDELSNEEGWYAASAEEWEETTYLLSPTHWLPLPPPPEREE